MSIPIFTAMYAVNVTSPAQLPLVSGCQNSGDILYGLSVGFSIIFLFLQFNFVNTFHNELDKHNKMCHMKLFY